MTPMAMLLGVVAVIGIVSAAIIISNIVVVNTHVLEKPELSFNGDNAEVQKFTGEYAILNPTVGTNGEYTTSDICEGQTYLTGVRLRSTGYSTSNVTVKFVISDAKSVNDTSIKYLAGYTEDKTPNLGQYYHETC